MSSNLVDFIFEEPKEGLLDFLLLEFTSLKKSDDYIKVLSFYNVEKCEQDECSQCLFAINLRYVFKKKKMLRNYIITA